MKINIFSFIYSLKVLCICFNFLAVELICSASKEDIVSLVSDLQSNFLEKASKLTKINDHIDLVDTVENKHHSFVKRQLPDSKNTVKLTILIDCFGKAKLSDLLESIYTQETTFDFDVVCFGEVNIPQFARIITKYKSKYKSKNINIFKISAVRGSSLEQHNEAVLKAQSNLVLHLSHLDILPPTFLQRLIDNQFYTKASVTAVPNIISLYPGEFSAVPRHDKFYTVFSMGENVSDIYALMADVRSEFIWGLLHGRRLFTKSAWSQSGGFAGSEKDRSANLGLAMLLKGYNFSILSNGFLYQYYMDGDWFKGVNNVSMKSMFPTINHNFSELINIIEECSSTSNFIIDRSLWINGTPLRYIIAAYKAECEGNYLDAAKNYSLAVGCGIKNDKIIYKYIRALFLSENKEGLLAVARGEL